MRTSMATEEVWHHQGVSHRASAQVKDGGFVSGWCNEQRKDDKCTRKEMIRPSVITAERRWSVTLTPFMTYYSAVCMCVYKGPGCTIINAMATAAIKLHGAYSQWPNLADCNSGANLCKSFTTWWWRAGCTEAMCSALFLSFWNELIHFYSDLQWPHPTTAPPKTHTNTSTMKNTLVT